MSAYEEYLDRVDSGELHPLTPCDDPCCPCDAGKIAADEGEAVQADEGMES